MLGVLQMRDPTDGVFSSEVMVSPGSHHLREWHPVHALTTLRKLENATRNMTAFC